MFELFGLLMLAGVALAFARILIPLILVLAVVVLGFNGHQSRINSPEYVAETHEYTYEELRHYPLNCDNAESQLAELRALQEKYNFDPDPDKLSHDDKAWNAIIKSNIWWFAYRCNKS